jgi:Tfp pilus assembly protein PilF
MKPITTVIRRATLIVSLGWVMSGAEPASAQANEDIRIVELRGVVEILPHGAANWVLTQTNQPLYPQDRIRTRANSSVGLLMSDRSVLRFDAKSEMEILPAAAGEGPGLHLIQGILSFFHRDKPGRIRVIAGGALAGIEGTEFVMAITGTNGDGETTLSVIDGKVRFENAGSVLLLSNGEQAVALPGLAPRRTPGFNANNLIQWCFYYPGILDLKELPLTDTEKTVLAGSLDAYRTGDLLAALAKYPAGRRPHSDAERVYLAALLVSAGQVEESEHYLNEPGAEPDDRNKHLAGALHTLIAAVQRRALPLPLTHHLSSELLADSYYQQSMGGPDALKTALALARCAATNSPEFGFAWERLAELEFSFGRTDRAQKDLSHALQLSPRNAEALALNGFLLAAQNRINEAITSFDAALALDSALGNAWLGRGLCRIRHGDLKEGREDLLVAAAMEPQRASLRSYLGKALGDAGDTTRARHELALAMKLDPNDPTAWLYLALLNEQNNRINEAVRDLEYSQDLNDDRKVYRSRLLLDQDRAVRSANLARIYQEAGMEDVAVREAARAADEDYANYSAHFFLANSYNALRDPNQINLRYETPTDVEYLLGNLLAPANAGVLSPSISQQEYSRLFERDRFGLLSDTEYLSRGAFTESAAQYGILDDSSYDLETYYRTDPGQRPNNDVEQRQFSLTFKQQFGPHDTLLGIASQYEGTGGDEREYYYQTNADLGLRTRETQTPNLLVGWNHEWAPGSHTLILGGRLQDTYEVTDSNSPVQSFAQPPGHPLTGLIDSTAKQNYHSDTVVYTAEVQQILQADENTLIGGLRFQDGTVATANFLSQPGNTFLPPGSPYEQAFDQYIERLSAYGYYLWKLLDSVQLTTGLTYDWLTYPQDFRISPISGGQQTEGQVSPKVGLVWTPFEDTVLRAAYTRSLGGASLEQSYQLEPSEVAGFNQLFRSIIPESVEGENAGARFETWNLALEQKIGSNTYFALIGQLLHSTVDRQSGDTIVAGSTYASTTPEHLDYYESDFQATADELLGRCWTVGLSYQLSDVRLKDQFSEVSYLVPVQNTSALLHQFEAHVRFNHPSGFFGQFEALWNDQHNTGYTVPEPGDSFWQFNVFAGYRTPRKHAELSVGLLNLGGGDYQLNPLNAVNELPRSRTLEVRCKLDF